MYTALFILIIFTYDSSLSNAAKPWCILLGWVWYGHSRGMCDYQLAGVGAAAVSLSGEYVFPGYD